MSFSVTFISELDPSFRVADELSRPAMSGNCGDCFEKAFADEDEDLALASITVAGKVMKV